MQSEAATRPVKMVCLITPLCGILGCFKNMHYVCKNEVSMRPSESLVAQEAGYPLAILVYHKCILECQGIKSVGVKN